ncbi:MAG: di-trans,poly-cis-decaprenylcistransferase [Planctomycetota bacterium]|nr:di-trans,poly-cis-decaprenylcistransferase [Planctomycetota bacterium]
MATTLWPTLEPPAPREFLPRHVAIIMDGNGRWASRRGLVRVRGHEAGVESVRDCVRYSGQTHLKALTLYAFSTENWKRPRTEVTYLMRLLKKYLIEERDELHANGVRLTSIGRVEELPKDVRECLEHVQEHTAGNRGLTLSLALNYGSQDEIRDAARALAGKVARGELSADEIDEAQVAAHLHTAGLPPVDLLIRTAGEQRISNFLLWQASGADFHVAQPCWPDFRRADLIEAMLAYAGRRKGAALAGPREPA